MAKKLPPIVSARGACNWIRSQLSPGDLKRQGHKDANAALVWFWAYTRIVPMMFEGTTRHIAQAMIAGDFKPPTYRSVAIDIEEYFQQDDDDEFDLREELFEFFQQGEDDE